MCFRKNHVVLGTGNVNDKSQQFKLPEEILLSSNLNNISISVKNKQWKRVDTLGNSSPSDRHYVLRREEEGEVSIQFGDGVNGSRLPSGKDNVKATYRTGAGAGGNVEERPTKRKKRVKKVKIKNDNL